MYMNNNYVPVQLKLYIFFKWYLGIARLGAPRSSERHGSSARLRVSMWRFFGGGHGDFTTWWIITTMVISPVISGIL